MRRGLATAVGALVVLGLLTACSASFRNHGFVPRASELATVEVGVDTKETVATKIGRPATDGLRQQNAWYYIESRFRHVGFSKPEEIEREVLVVTFGALGTVSNIQMFGIEAGRVIQLTSRETPTSTPDLGFIQALFKNFGQTSPGSLLN